ncbi:DUF927 domain-containing protein [Paenibacillus sp. Pae15]|uniref:DUF927 domain-containing protein n=1 Tax=Paenibacillus sp. Pae15 TaxID=2926018 RepID=UPI002118AE14|nr:DUF927 domain-containing protein [Paenibacillus sp. Pae15]
MRSPIAFGYEREDMDKEALLERLSTTLSNAEQNKEQAIQLLFRAEFLEALAWLQIVSYPDFVELKKQAEKLIPSSEFRKALAQKLQVINREAQAFTNKDIPTLGEALEDCPQEIAHLQFPFGWWISKDGVFRSHTDRMGNVEYVKLCSWPLIVSGVYRGYQDGEMKLELMFHRWEDWQKIVLNRSDALNYKKLQEIAAAKGAPIDSSNSKDVVRYLSAFEAANDGKYPLKRTVDKIGWIPERKLLITSNGIYSVNGEHLNDSDIIYQPGKELIQFSIKQCDNWQETAKAVFPQLLNLNHFNVTLPVIGWFFASAVAPFIRAKRDNQYPILVCWGKSGSGKTTLIEIMLKITGNPNEPQKISTPYALTVQLSSNNTLPVVFDEYKPSEMTERTLSDFLNKLKLCYRADSDSRGKPGGVQTYTLSCPVIFIGEDYPRENQAVVERSVTVQLERNWIEQNKVMADSVFKNVMSNDLEAASSGFWNFIFHYLEQGFLDEDIEEASKIAETFESIHFRVRWNTTVLLTGMRMYQRILEFLNCEVAFGIEEMKRAAVYTLSAAMEDQESMLDRILLAFNYDHRQFSESDIWLDQENHLLYVTASKFKAYVTMNNQFKCSAAQLKYEMEYCCHSGGYVGNGKREYYVQKKIRGRNGWRYVFNTLKLEEATGISGEAWLPNESEPPDEVTPPPERRVHPERSARLKSLNRKTPS